MITFPDTRAARIVNSARITSALTPTPSSRRRRKAKLIGSPSRGGCDLPDRLTRARAKPCRANDSSRFSVGVGTEWKSGTKSVVDTTSPSDRPRPRERALQSSAAPTSALSVASTHTLRSRWTLTRCSLRASQSSTSSNRRGSLRPTSKVNSRSASGSAARSSRRSRGSGRHAQLGPLVPGQRDRIGDDLLSKLCGPHPPPRGRQVRAPWRRQTVRACCACVPNEPQLAARHPLAQAAGDR